MFTGLVEALGTIADVANAASGLRLRIDTTLADSLVPGDSLAVNGVCLTVVTADRTGVQADVSPETARVTTLGAARRGGAVNLERPLRADGRLGGHFVQGHVDAPGRIEEIRDEGESHWITVQYPSQLERYIVRKGSIAVDGVSLTVAGVDARCFDVQIIPFTWEHTNFSGLRAGDAVNLECDVLAKYVARALGKE